VELKNMEPELPQVCHEINGFSFKNMRKPFLVRITDILRMFKYWFFKTYFV